jgi:hypothetical protein
MHTYVALGLILFACAAVRASPFSPRVGSNPPVADIGLGDADAHAQCGGMLFGSSSHGSAPAQRQVGGGGMHTKSTKTYTPMTFEIDMEPSRSSLYTCQTADQVLTIHRDFISNYRCSSESTTNCIVRCTAADVVDDAKRAQALKLMRQSTDWLSKALQVDSAPTTFVTSTLSHPCAGWNYNTSAHFKVFVILAPLCGGQSSSSGVQGCSGKTLLGQAQGCTRNTNPNTNTRVLSAVVILSVGVFQSVSSALVTHELTHALGFNSGVAVDNGAVYIRPSNRATYDSSSQYHYYSDEVPLAAGDGSPSGTLSLPAASFPTVAQQLRLHLGCSATTLADNKLFIPWENQGSPGSRNTHWETRVFGNEFMVAALPGGTIVLSRMTLAFLHDIKWYKVTPEAMSSYGEELQWGKGLGCGFLTGKCSDWVSGGMAAFSSADDKASLTAYQNTFFCNKAYSSTPDDCTYDGGAIGSCSLRTYSGTISPAMFQYAALGAGKGGDSNWADFCPFVSGFSGTACTVDDASRYKYNPDLIPYGNVGGPTNVCIKGTLSAPEFESYTAMSCMFSNCVSATSMALYNVDSKEWGLCERQSDGSYMAFKAGSGVWKDVRCPWPKFACGENARKKAMPVITSMFPTRGPSYGGHPITLLGSNFMSFFVGAPEVGFLEALGISFPLSRVKVVSPGLLVAITGDLSQAALSSVNVFISWTDPFQRKTVSNIPYFVDVNWPRITSMEPTSGLSDGGGIITLKGQNFPVSKQGGNYVKFSNAQQFEFTIVSSREITVRLFRLIFCRVVALTFGMLQVVLPPQGEIGPSVGSDIVNVESHLDDGKMVYADVQFEYICEGPCYFKSMIMRFVALACSAVP